MAQPATETAKSAPSRKTLRTAGRKKREARLKTDAEYRKTYHEAKSKRSTDKKAAFRKKKKGKK